jgi:biofilm protein TabA
MEVLPADRLELEEDLLESKDVCFFRDVQAASVWRVEEGEVAVFFPADAHMPSLALEAPAIVFKTVVKVPVLA